MRLLSYFCTFLFFLPFFLSAQGDYKLVIDQPSSIRYDEYGEVVVPTNDGGILIAGYTESLVGIDDDMIFIRLNSSGELVWSKRWSTGEHDHPISVIAESDGRFIIYGFSGPSLFLAEMKSDGDISWAKTYRPDTDNGYFIPTGMIRVGNRYAMVTEYSGTDVDARGADILIHYVDLLGQKESTVQFDHPEGILKPSGMAAGPSGSIGIVGRIWAGQRPLTRIDGFLLSVTNSSVNEFLTFAVDEDNEFEAICADEKGSGFFISGTTNLPDPFGYIQKPVIMRANLESISWAKITDLPVTPLHHENGSLFLLSTVDDAVEAQGGKDIRIMEMTTGGDFTHTQFVDYSFFISQDDLFRDASFDQDGRILITGRASPNFPNEYGFVELISLSGNSSCADAHSTSSPEFTSFQASWTDGGIIEKPTAPIFNETDIRTNIQVEELNAEVRTLCSLTTSTEEAQNKELPFSITPNPVRDLIWVEFEDKNEIFDGHLSVRNALGKVVYQKKVNSIGAQSIPVASLATGIYFITYKTRSEEWSDRFIKQ